MSSSSTTWTTDTNTKSGSASTFTQTVSSLKLLGEEGGDAILDYLQMRLMIMLINGG